MTQSIPFNINDNVRVQLTEQGKTVHRNNFEKLMGRYAWVDYAPPEEDSDGWSTWQLWVLMLEFGSHQHMGDPLMFHPWIQIVTQSKEEKAPTTRPASAESIIGERK